MRRSQDARALRPEALVQARRAKRHPSLAPCTEPNVPALPTKGLPMRSPCFQKIGLSGTAALGLALAVLCLGFARLAFGAV